MSDTGTVEADLDRLNSASEERKDKAAAEAYDRIQRGQHWLDWMEIATGLEVGRHTAQRRAGTEDIQNPKYKKAFKEWMSTRPYARDLDQPTRAHLFWCLDYRNDIDRWRDTLATNERARINHPTAMKRKFEKAHQTDPGKGHNAPPKKETKAEAQMRENEELWAENAKLKRRVESGDGSLFDLHRDSIETIVDVMAGTVPLGRFESLQRAMTKKLAALKAAEKTKQAKAG